MGKIAVLIPCYNESKTIEKVVKNYKAKLPDADIYVYDNNSTDNTDKIAKKAGAVVKYEYRQGKGNVIRSMFKDIDANMSFDLVHDNTQFNLKAPDHLYVKLSYKDLKKLKVKYVFTLRNVDDDFKMEDIKFDKIFADKQIYIYKII